MNSIAARLRDRWSSTGCNFRPGASESRIESFESNYGVLLPGHFREYLLNIDGLREGERDNQMISFWPLDSIKSVPECLSDFSGIPDYSMIATRIKDASSYFVFADYLIWSHVYAIRLSPSATDSSRILWLCGSEYYLMAESFYGFLEKYLNNPESILFPLELKSRQTH